VSGDRPPLETAVPDSATRLARHTLGVLRNPGSGANLRRGKPMQQALAAYPDILCRDVANPSDVDAALSEMAARGVDTLAISGGDGTVSAVLNTIFARNPFPRRPRLAVLRGGTANMTARDIGMRGPQHRALPALIDALARGGERLAVTRRPVIRIDAGAEKGADSRDVLRSGGDLAGYRLLQASRARAWPARRDRARGHDGALRDRDGKGRAGDRCASPMTVAVDDEPPVSFDCEIVHVTTLEELVLGIRPYWGREDAPLHYASVRAKPRHWMRALPGVLRGRPGRVATADKRIFEPQRASAFDRPRYAVLRRRRALRRHNRDAAHADRRRRRGVPDVAMTTALDDAIAVRSRRPRRTRWRRSERASASASARTRWPSFSTARAGGRTTTKGGIVDLYVLVDRYRAAYGSALPAIANALLAPNVYYIEVPFAGRIARAKYAVISLEHFERGVARWFHPVSVGRGSRSRAASVRRR
jgi:hypothetical protein